MRREIEGEKLSIDVHKTVKKHISIVNHYKILNSIHITTVFGIGSVNGSVW